MSRDTIAVAIASACQARLNCVASKNSEWFTKWTERIQALTRDYLPSGSGFDSGTKFDYTASAPNRLVFHTSFHHMDSNGFYGPWTEHTVTVRPDFISGLTISISGRDRDGWKDYAYDSFYNALTLPAPELKAD